MRGKVKPLPIVGLAAIFAMACFLISPARYGKCVLDGISLWAICVLPATFPFLFLTAVLTRSPLFAWLSKKISPIAGRLFRVSGTGGCAAVLSALSGYPVGARTVLDLHEGGMLGEDERFRLACLATTSGPMFLVGTVGSGMMGRPSLGWLMLLCHFLGVWTVSFVLARGKKRPDRLSPLPQRGGGLYESVYGSVISILCVGGSIALFSAFGQILLDLFPALPPWAEGLVRGLIEMTSGCKAFSTQITPLSLALCCFFVTFGGVCVLVQELAFLSQSGIKALPFLAVKCAQGLVAGGFCYLFALLF